MHNSQNLWNRNQCVLQGPNATPNDRSTIKNGGTIKHRKNGGKTFILFGFSSEALIFWHIKVLGCQVQVHWFRIWELLIHTKMCHESQISNYLFSAHYLDIIVFTIPIDKVTQESFWNFQSLFFFPKLFIYISKIIFYGKQIPQSITSNFLK